MIFFSGQAATQRPQPLQRVTLILGTTGMLSVILVPVSFISVPVSSAFQIKEYI